MYHKAGLQLLLMDVSFDLTLNYNRRELLLPARLIQFGYTYKIEVDLNGTLVSFERDEEKNWRALIDPNIETKINVDLLNAIVQAIENL